MVEKREKEGGKQTKQKEEKGNSVRLPNRMQERFSTSRSNHEGRRQRVKTAKMARKVEKSVWSPLLWRNDLARAVQGRSSEGSQETGAS